MAAARTRVGLDSSFLVPLLSGLHEHHARTFACYEHWMARKAEWLVPVQVLLESFSTLTRLPAPYRMPPDDAKQAIETMLSRNAVVIGLDSATAWDAIDTVTHAGYAGGRVYDASIAACVAKAGATTLLTWNTKHFVPAVTRGMTVQQP